MMAYENIMSITQTLYIKTSNSCLPMNGDTGSMREGYYWSTRLLLRVGAILSVFSINQKTTLPMNERTFLHTKHLPSAVVFKRYAKFTFIPEIYASNAKQVPIPHNEPVLFTCLSSIPSVDTQTGHSFTSIKIQTDITQVTHHTGCLYIE